MSFIHEDGSPDTYEDLQNCVRGFAVALGHLLQEGEGVVVIVQPENKKWMIYKDIDKIRIEENDSDLESGQMLWVHTDPIQ